MPLQEREYTFLNGQLYSYSLSDPQGAKQRRIVWRTITSRLERLPGVTNVRVFTSSLRLQLDTPFNTPESIAEFDKYVAALIRIAASSSKLFPGVNGKYGTSLGFRHADNDYMYTYVRQRFGVVAHDPWESELIAELAEH